MINIEHVSISHDAFSLWNAPSNQTAVEAVVEALNEVGLKSLTMNLRGYITSLGHNPFSSQWLQLRRLLKVQLIGGPSNPTVDGQLIS
jgi:hypothetical protein